MAKHFVILINGKRRSGKGLLSTKIKEKLEKTRKFNNVQLHSFAEDIKASSEFIINNLGWENEQKEIIRPLWITIGAVGRKINEDFWSRRVLDKIRTSIFKQEKEDKNTIFIIDDLRFPYELNFFKENEFNINEELKKTNGEFKVISVRIEKYIDSTNFLQGIDDDVTENSFDNLVYTVFDYLVPMDVLIDRQGNPRFQNVESQADTIILNYIKKRGN